MECHQRSIRTALPGLCGRTDTISR